MPAAAHMASAHRRILIAGSVGNFIEWYEFAVYGFMASLLPDTFFSCRMRTQTPA